MTKLDKAIKEVKELRESDERHYQEEREKMESNAGIGTFYSKDGMRMYLVGHKQIFEYTCIVPFSKGHGSIYVGKIEWAQKEGVK